MEKQMIRLGKSRFHSSINKLKGKQQESSTSYGKHLAKGLLPSLAKVLQKWFEGGSNVAGYNRDIAKVVGDIPTEVLADITCRVVLDSISLQVPLGTLTLKLGAFVEEEARLRMIRSNHKEYWGQVETSLNKRVGFSYKKYSSHALAKRLGIEWTAWSPTLRGKVGSVLVDLFRKATGLIELVLLSKDRKKQVYHIKPTDAAVKWITGYKQHHEDLCPLYLPSDSPSGYSELPVQLCKTNQREHLAFLDKNNLEVPLKALSRLQATPWVVNRGVLEVAEYLWKNQMNIAGFPPSKLDRMPPKPSDIDTNKKARDLWKQETAYYHRADLKNKGIRLTISKVLWVASEYKDKELFYFPHQFDFRGRLYSVPNFLNYQSVDLSRGLLEFHEGKPLTEEGEDWFLKCGKTLWDNSCPTIEEARTWLITHEHLIKQASKDATQDFWWSNAHKPWQFLAWCLEASKWCEGRLSVSKLPLSIDASSNGLQIMSLMLRYPEGAIDTNCSSRTKSPVDLYEKILKEVELKLQSSSLGWDWIELKLDRSLIKSIIMTIPYGCTKYRAEELVLQWYYLRNTKVFEGKLRKALAYLVSTIFNIFYDLYPKLSEFMTFLELTSDNLGQPVTWVSPSGFPVYQAYFKSKAKRIKTLIFGRIRSIQYQDALPDEYDKAKMARALTPNLIHSLDASILHKTLANFEGSVATVHDSFVTHAGDMNALVASIKQSYVEVFSESPKVFFQKIFSSETVDKQALKDMAETFSSLSGDFSIDEICSAAYMYR